LDSIQIEGQKIYFFGLSLKQKSNLKDVYATNIRFNHNEAQTYSIGKYHIKTNAFSTPKELSVVESPITQNVTPQLNSIQSISYKIMTTEKITDILNFEIEIPSEYKYIFEIIETKSELDKNTTDEMYKLYREHKSEKELENFRIYSLNVKYCLRQKANIIFQPIIKSELNGEDRYAAPSSPF